MPTSCSSVMSANKKCDAISFLTAQKDAVYDMFKLQHNVEKRPSFVQEYGAKSKCTNSVKKEISLMGINDLWDFCHSFCMLTDQDDESNLIKIDQQYRPMNKRKECSEPTFDLRKMKTGRSDHPSVYSLMSFRGTSWKPCPGIPGLEDTNVLCKKTIQCLSHSSTSTAKEQSSEKKRNTSSSRSESKMFDNKWNLRYNELKKFHHKFGHCNVPHTYISNEKLGVWVRNQRSQFKRSQDGKHTPLNPSRIAALNKLGFEFNYYNALWTQRYCELKQFKAIYGHCNVPNRHEANHPLGVWVGTQRTQYKKMCANQPSRLNADRIKALSELGFEWAVKN